MSTNSKAIIRAIRNGVFAVAFSVTFNSIVTDDAKAGGRWIAVATVHNSYARPYAYLDYYSPIYRPVYVVRVVKRHHHRRYHPRYRPRYYYHFHGHYHHHR